MTWKYDQSSGELFRNGILVSKGYSGAGRGKNNPSLQGVQGIGPIPRGRWRMANIYDSKNVGPLAISLYCLDDGVVDDFDTRTGRGAFRIHGDSVRAPGTASKGCIILPRPIRDMMWRSRDHDIEIVE